MSGAAVIEIESLSRRFGRLCAVDDLSLAVDEGEIVGFLGPNGAGKTTTVRTLMGFLRPTAGSCRVLGVWPGGDVGVRGRIGYLPGDVRVEPGMRASQLFAWFARSPSGTVQLSLRCMPRAEDAAITAHIDGQLRNVGGEQRAARPDRPASVGRPVRARPSTWSRSTTWS